VEARPDRDLNAGLADAAVRAARRAAEEDPLASRVEGLEARLAELASRVALLERAAGAPPEGEASGAASPPFALLEDLPGAVARGLLIVGGAFLIRALTDAGVLPVGVGLAFGMAYGWTWIGRALFAGRPRWSTVEALAGAAVLLPLGFEGVARFGMPVAPAAAFLLVTGGALSAATPRAGPAAGWAAGLGVASLAVSLAVQTRRPDVFALVLVALATAARWADGRRATGSPAVMAGAVTLLLLMAALTSGRGWTEAGYPSDLAVRGFAIALLALAAVVASPPARRRETPVPSGVVAHALVLGGLATLLAARAAVEAREVVALAGALFAGFVLVLAARRGGLSHDRFFTTTAVVALSALAALLPRGPALFAWCAVAGTSSILLRRRSHPMFFIGLALPLGLAAAAHPPGAGAVPPATAAFAWCVLAGARAAPPVRWLRAGSGAFALVGAAVLAPDASPALLLASGGHPDTVRTVALALGAALAAVVARRARWTEERAVAWLLFAAATAHAALADLPAASAGRRFAALAALGIALLAVARSPAPPED
jgi:hypothetical protein